MALAAAMYGYLSLHIVFTGGWHDSGDGSYGCPASAWHTFRHPLRPGAFGPLLRGIPEACNNDARMMVLGWMGISVLVLAVVGVALAVAIQSRQPVEPSIPA